ncbi:MAG TPA: methylated-DNA--[protein]-cysteine S-methyltransferase [Pseudonocardia sp.]|jgi:methylated-DNA-[protein]-cysteine S-methyltransferase
MTENFLPAPPEIAGHELAGLLARLAAAAEREGLLDVAYRTVPSPIGDLLLAATDKGLVRLAFASEGQEPVLTELAEKVSPRVLAAPKRLDPVARELDEYFTGRRTRFEVPVDLRLASGFRLAVITRLPEIDYGRTYTYAQMAAAAGSPRAVRAVGTACARNPVPIVLPCHRVVRSDGTYGQYRGGQEAKHTLLTMEVA